MSITFSPTYATAMYSFPSSSLFFPSFFSIKPLISSVYSITDAQTIRFTASEGSECTLLNLSAAQNMEKLSEIGKLKDNWNGYGAHKFGSTVINNAKTMLRVLKEQPFISPTARQSIQMEFDGKNGDYFEIEVFADSIDVYTSIGSQEEEISLPVEASSYERIAEMAERFNG